MIESGGPLAGIGGFGVVVGRWDSDLAEGEWGTGLRVEKYDSDLAE